MATIDEINLLDYQAPTPEQILKAGRKPVAEPTPPSLSPATDYFYENILNPEGRKLVDMARGEVNNPLNFMAGAGGISRVAQLISNRQQKILKLQRELDTEDMSLRSRRQAQSEIARLIQEIKDMSK